MIVQHRHVSHSPEGETQMAQRNQGGGTSNRGFASMDPARQRAIAAEGGRAAHAQGVAHEFDSEEAREAGRKGGQARSQRSAGLRAGSDRDVQGADLQGTDMQGTNAQGTNVQGASLSGSAQSTNTPSGGEIDNT
jgi:uncharacterized protein